MRNKDAIRLVAVSGHVYEERRMPCIPLMIDSGGYFCSVDSEPIERLKRRKIGNKMWVIRQYAEQQGIFKATLCELFWNADKTKVRARFI